MRIICLLFVAATLQAQLPISIGVKGGGVLNQISVPRTVNEIFPLKGGPYLELSLPFLPIIESGVMFENYNSPSGSLLVYQVPLLLKKRFNAIAIKPFVAGGATLRMVPSRNEQSGGATFALGFTVGLLPIKIEPELRYTHWFNTVETPRPQQIEFLVGIRF